MKNGENHSDPFPEQITVISMGVWRRTERCENWLGCVEIAKVMVENALCAGSFLEELLSN